ncbi:MAG: response regulator [Deltaproteobacteria bacterium]|nr:response regulator [Deltaproteobacteria bacterium]
MQDRNHWGFRYYLNKRRGISLLGIKIAAVIGAGLLFYAALDLYRHYGGPVAGKEVIGHYFWAVPVAAFATIMAALSVLVIKPLKKFEMHIREIQEGRPVGPLVFDRNDEIGYLVERFNDIHKTISEKIELRDMELNVIHSFMDKAAAMVDIAALMSGLFSKLRGFIRFDAGAFFVCHRGYSQAMIFVSKGLESQARDMARGFFDKAGQICPDMAGTNTVKNLEVKTLWTEDERGFHAGNPDAVNSVEFPLICWGHNVGMASFITLNGQEIPHASRLIESMLNHAGIVLERMLASISREERRLSTILSSMTEGVYVIDRFGAASCINPKGEELLATHCRFGADCLKNGEKRGLFNCPHGPEESCEFSHFVENIRTGELGRESRSAELKGADNSMLHATVCGFSSENCAEDGYVITARDVTEERKIQQKLALSSRLTSLGEMAAGIAHEINNPLQAILCSIELLTSGADGAAQKSSCRMDRIKESIYRIKGIVRDLLVFSREQTTENEPADINELAARCEHMIRNQFRVSKINIELKLYGRALPVLCNRNLFEQVIINLLNNAKDAISDSGKGSLICIETGHAESGRAFVRVWDDGPGIPFGVIGRVFDPFFTTKDVGKGTGLGLSLSRKIIENIGGSINVESNHARGAVFTINLPLFAKEAALKDKPGENQGPAPPDYSSLKDKTVLMIDDEDDLLSSMGEILSRKVAAFHSASTGGAGMEKVMDKDFDFILLDLKMPKMDGFEFYRKVSEVKPWLAERIIFLTGDTESEGTRSFLKLCGNRYLPKPFDVNELLETMRAEAGDYGDRGLIHGRA